MASSSKHRLVGTTYVHREGRRFNLGCGRKPALGGCEQIVASEGKSRSAGAQEPECILKYMRIPSTAGTRDPERSRFIHKLLARAYARNPS